MSWSRFSSLALALALAGCGGGDGGSTGTLNVGITDAPVDNASDVIIEINGIEVHGPGGTTAFDLAPQQVHLMELTGGAAQTLLSGVTLPAGHYQWMRLKVNTANSYVLGTDGGTYGIRIPSNAQTGLKVVRGFTVPAGGSADFTIDFDLRKSLVDTNGATYTLKPVLRMVDNVQVGVIAGNVDLAHYNCAASGDAVYIYQGQGVSPSDLNTTTGGGPLVVAPVTADSGGAAYHYRAAFLPAGDYTVALTCQAATDLPESSENLVFSDTYNVTVTAGHVSAQPFPAP